MDPIDRWLGRATKSLHMLAAVWLFFLAFLILGDVLGRNLFNQPIPGTPEIVANSLVSIAFLQLSHSIRMNGMLRAEFLQPYLSPKLWRLLAGIGCLFGVALFLAIAYASWVPMLNAWEISEYSGEGALRVPTYPVRSVVVAMSLLAAICYVGLAVREFRGDFDATTPPPPTL